MDPSELAKHAIVERYRTCERENALYLADFHAYEAWAEAAGLDPEDHETSVVFRRVHPRPPPRTVSPFEMEGLRKAVELLTASCVDPHTPQD